MTLLCHDTLDATVIPMEVLKTYLKIDHEDDDALLQTMLQTAHHLIEQYASISLLRRRWSYRISHKSIDCGKQMDRMHLRIPFQCVREITRLQIKSKQHVRTIDAFESVISETDAEMWIPREHLQDADALKVSFVAGFDAVEEVPVYLRHSVLLSAADFYAQRESQGSNPDTPYRLPKKVCVLLHGYQPRPHLS